MSCECGAGFGTPCPVHDAGQMALEERAERWGDERAALKLRIDALELEVQRRQNSHARGFQAGLEGALRVAEECFDGGLPPAVWLDRLRALVVR